MRVLFIQQDHVSPVGPVGERFSDRGYDVEEFLVVPAERFHDPGVTVAFPDPLAFDAIVPMGAVWSVYDDSVIGTWLHDELHLLRTAHNAGVPILGICFGGQSLAAALGGHVELAPEAEVGWHSVRSDRSDLVEPGQWFQWHHDRWVPPTEAETFARTDIAPQAFTMGRSLALQFHPEVTTATLAGWYANGGAEYMAEHGLDADEIYEQTRECEPTAIARTHRLVDAFLDQIATRPLT